jgi:hypothetical protein
MSERHKVILHNKSKFAKILTHCRSATWTEDGPDSIDGLIKPRPVHDNRRVIFPRLQKHQIGMQHILNISSPGDVRLARKPRGDSIIVAWKGLVKTFRLLSVWLEML